VAAFLVIAPEHARVFWNAGWSKQRLKDELHERLQVPVRELKPGFGNDEQLEKLKHDNPDATVPKFRSGSLNIVRAGGTGLFAAIISGIGSITINPTIKEVKA
jgi:hypothetical protein